jgi:hypothetical protein
MLSERRCSAAALHSHAAHLLPNLEQALLGADIAVRPLGATHGAKEHSVSGLAGVERLVRQGRAMPV